METIERLDKPWMSVCEGSCAVVDETWQLDRDGYVYFIGARGLRGLVKIGWARDPIARLNALQVGNPERLELFATFSGTREDEVRMHAEFKHLRSKGEWFDPDHDLMLLIISLGAEYTMEHHDGSECGDECLAQIVKRFLKQLDRSVDPYANARRRTPAD